MDFGPDKSSEPVAESVEYFDTTHGNNARRQAWTHACMPKSKSKRRSQDSIEPITSDDEEKMTSAEKSTESLTPPPSPKKKKKKKSVPEGTVFSLEGVENLDNALMRPIPKGAEIRGYVLRNKRMGMYQFHLDKSDKAVMLAVKNRKAKRSINYKISSTSGGEASLFRRADSDDHIGKLRGNLVGQEWVLFDNGKNPSKRGDNPVRRELGGMWYPVRTQGPRIMQVGLPKVNEDGETTIVRPFTARESIVHRLKTGTGVEVTNLINKTPQYDPVKKIHQLNFHGRVTEASIKNFMLTDNGVNDKTLLLFGRVEKDKFTLDFSHPLSPLQAFGIALSQLLRPLR